ncbi:MAG: hypothetical protein P8P29_03210 [Flavobacteriaceae bacterium]|nr:hypothetical protein [Flavobacteriaceae bacterium]
MRTLFKGSDKTKLRKAYEKRFGVVEGEFALYNKDGNIVYFEASKSRWSRWERDSKGNITLLESSNRISESYFNSSWFIKSEYGPTGKEVYREDSINGITIDERPEVKTIIIGNKEYTLTEVEV